MKYSARNIHNEKTGFIDPKDIHILLEKNVNLDNQGYARIGATRLHRIIASIIFNKPIKEVGNIDHINGDKLDNRRSNLREVTVLQNNLNKKNRERKYFGSTFLKKRNKWQAQIKINGKQTYLGVFDCEKKAQECYLNKARELGRL